VARPVAGLVRTHEERAPLAVPFFFLSPHGGAEGQASDIEISAKHILKLRNNLNKILAKNTGQPLSKIEKDVDRDLFMDAEEAKKYGIIDGVMGKK
jgi:ATP-dependent Clp protease protease subunit